MAFKYHFQNPFQDLKPENTNLVKIAIFVENKIKAIKCNYNLNFQNYCTKFGTNKYYELYRKERIK